jgi:hypothetical protein
LTYNWRASADDVVMGILSAACLSCAASPTDSKQTADIPTIVLRRI